MTTGLTERRSDQLTAKSPTSTLEPQLPLPPVRGRPIGTGIRLVTFLTVAAGLMVVNGSQAYGPVTSKPFSCDARTMRDTHTYPHDYVGEVYLTVATNSPAGISSTAVIAWGKYRYPANRRMDIAPASKGGTTFFFAKRDGLSEPNYEVVARSTVPLCFRWGTLEDLGINIPGPDMRPAKGWVEGHDNI